MSSRTSSCQKSPRTRKSGISKTARIVRASQDFRLLVASGSLTTFLVRADAALPKPNPITAVKPATAPCRNGMRGSSVGVIERQKKMRAPASPANGSRPQKIWRTLRLNFCSVTVAEVRPTRCVWPREAAPAETERTLRGVID